MWDFTCRVMPDAGIADANTGIFVRGPPVKFPLSSAPAVMDSCESQRASVRHGIARIHAKVQQNLMNLAAVCGDRAEDRARARVEADRFGKRRLQHALQLADKRVQIDGGKTRLGLAGGSEELLHERRAALDRFLDDL